MRLSNSFPTLSASPRSPLGVPVAGASAPPVALVPWTAHAGMGGRPARSPPAPAPQTRFPPPRCDSSSCALSAVHPHDSAPSRSPTLPPFPSPSSRPLIHPYWAPSALAITLLRFALAHHRAESQEDPSARFALKLHQLLGRRHVPALTGAQCWRARAQFPSPADTHLGRAIVRVPPLAGTRARAKGRAQGSWLTVRTRKPPAPISQRSWHLQAPAFGPSAPKKLLGTPRIQAQVGDPRRVPGELCLRTGGLGNKGKMKISFSPPATGNFRRFLKP